MENNSAKAMPKVTPLLQQYFAIKKQYGDCLLFMQVGDFYELFFEEAKIASKYLSIVLTKQGKYNDEDVPMCGVPVSSINYHISKLIKNGFKVAICDQVSRPIPGEIVQRKVTRVFTPGTLTDELMLDKKKPSFLCALWPLNGEWSIVFAELLSSKIFATSFKKDDIGTLDAELFRFFPDEVLFPENGQTKNLKQHLQNLGFFLSSHELADLIKESSVEDFFSFDKNAYLADLAKKLNQDVASKFVMNSSLQKAFAFLTIYLARHHESFLEQIEEVNIYKPEDFVKLDFAAIKNLELFQNNSTQTKEGSLFSVLDECKTGMGSRMLKHAISFPLKNLDEINKRLDVVEYFKNSYMSLSLLGKMLGDFLDFDRIVGRISLNKATFNDYLGIKSSLEQIHRLKKFLFSLGAPFDLLIQISSNLHDFSALYNLLQASLEDVSTTKRIKSGFNAELDSLRAFADNASEEILKFEKDESVRIGISNLKIKYTDNQGYFFEVNANQLSQVPDNYKLIQSLVGRSKFVSNDLKSLEWKILNAQENIDRMETRLFHQVVDEVKKYLVDLRRTAHSVALLDMMYSLSLIAYQNKYSRPVFVQENCLKIVQGRHPVVELCCDGKFTPNDTMLDSSLRTIILTGPNMGGKSTYLRQVALIVLQSHLGSFVPASSCVLSLHDRIFTRIGSGDFLAKGKSTFLVEMEEVAEICANATENSLVILDEVGRGTSTYDGIAIAQSILEYLHFSVKSKTFFATHYHEITDLEQKDLGIKNFFMKSEQRNDNIVFLHKLAQGKANESFGIAVAKLANLPGEVIKNSKTILQQLKAKHRLEASNYQINFEAELKTDAKQENEELLEIIEVLKNLDMDDVSFKLAHEILQDLKSKID